MIKANPKRRQGARSRLLILLGVLFALVTLGRLASAGIYSESGHGDDSTGVNRSSATCENWPGGQCVIGSCAHCHDTFDPSICESDQYGLMLFASNTNPPSQTENFCFQCHKGSGSLQVGGAVTNNDYGATFGGGTAMFDNIYDAFNPSGTDASAHDLIDVQSYARSSAWGSWMTENTNACLVCHDHHFSQKNFPVQINSNGGVYTAVRRGDDVVAYPGDLWGDEPAAVSGRNEMMSDWVTEYLYQAPLRGDSGYEPGPAGSTVQDGSNLPNFVDACAETCHSQDISAETGPIAVNWTTSRHGKAAADNAAGDWGWLKPPYSDTLRGSYVLACTDCHEPHGSSNATLLRTTVNGVSGLTGGAKGCEYPDGGYWYYWCQACHDLTYNPETGEGHPVVYPTARCGDSMGCHLFKTMGYDKCPGGDHSFEF